MLWVASHIAAQIDIGKFGLFTPSNQATCAK
jgi:hypothetical protein